MSRRWCVLEAVVQDRLSGLRYVDGNGPADLPQLPRARRCSGGGAESKETLRRFALNDERFVESVAARGHANIEASGLDQKTHALVRLGALLAIEATASSYGSKIEMALAAGASVDEIIGTLVAVAPDVGTVRAVAAAPELALALGYDVDVAFESPDEDVG